jgi:hypothetical protein
MTIVFLQLIKTFKMLDRVHFINLTMHNARLYATLLSLALLYVHHLLSAGISKAQTNCDIHSLYPIFNIKLPFNILCKALRGPTTQ